MTSKKTARFTISADNGKVQDVGYRIFILTTLEGYGLEPGKPINIPGDGVEITVKGEEEIIRAAIKELRKEKPGTEDVGKINVSEPEFSDFELTPFDDRELRILTLNQLSKGIPAIIGMAKVVGGLDTKYGAISRKMSIQTIIQVIILSLILFAVATNLSLF